MSLTPPIRQTDRVFAGYLTWNGEEWWDKRDRNFLESIFWEGDPEEWWRLYEFMLFQRDEKRRLSTIRQANRKRRRMELEGGTPDCKETPDYKRQRSETLDSHKPARGLMLPPSSLPPPHLELHPGIVPDSQDSQAPHPSSAQPQWRLDGMVPDSQGEDSDDDL